ncbi:MAG: hypothetical protein GY706_00615, partial [Bacteroides sp.]|nr:hypothetical protein [Bacteroides sp.]
ILLIITHVVVFNTHQLAESAESSQEDENGFGKGTGFAAFNAVTAAEVDLYSGSSALSVPIFVPPGRKGLNPNVAISYASHGGNSWCGMGWNLDFGSIARSTKNGVPKYDSTDKYVLNFGGSSELIDIGNDEYRMKHEALFMKIEKQSNQWVLTDKSGTQYFFGRDIASRFEPKGSGNVFSWHLDRVEDTNGNYMTYDYVIETHTDGGKQIYPESVRYNGHYSPAITPTHSIHFELDDRDDVTFTYITGARVTTAKLLKGIKVKVNIDNIDQIARRYEITYAASPSTGRSLLTEIQEYGKDDQALLNPIKFQYNELEKAFENAISFDNILINDDNDSTFKAISKTVPKSSDGHTSQCSITELRDMNRDGILDRISKHTGANNTAIKVQYGLQDGTGFNSSINSITNFQSVSHDFHNYLSNYFPDVQNSIRGSLIDLNSDGLPDRFLANDSNDLKFFKNEGASFQNYTIYRYDGQAGRDSNGFIRANSNEKYRHFKTNNKKGSAYVEIVDFDGDGDKDRIIARGDGRWFLNRQDKDGDGFTYNNASEEISGVTEQYFGGNISNTNTDTPNVSETNLILNDLNGDGLPDRITQLADLNTTWKVQFNNGNGFEAPQDWGGVELYGDGVAFFTYPRVTFHSRLRNDLIDINGDGLPDRVIQPSSGFDYYMVQYNTGSSFSPAVKWENLDRLDDNTIYATLGYSEPSGRQYVALHDIDADGLLDRVMLADNSDNHWTVQHNSGDFPDLLKTIDSGKGGTTTFEYTPSTRYDNYHGDNIGDLGFVIQTVSKVIKNDGLGNSYDTKYEYEGGMYDYDDREFRGFEKVKVIDHDDNYSLSTYSQHDIYQGKLLSKETRAANDDLFVKTETTWKVRYPNSPENNEIQFVYVEAEDEYIYETEASPKHRRTEFDYDDYGNLEMTIELGDVETTGDERTTIHEYDYSRESDWIMNLLKRTELREGAGLTGSVIAEKFFSYDNKGNLLNEEEFNNQGANPTTSMTYDSFGNIETITDARGKVTENRYDTTYYQFLEEVENDEGHTQKFEYDELLAKITKTTDANNNSTETIYDALGRPLKVIETVDTAGYPTKQFSYRKYEDSDHLERVMVQLREKSGESGTLDSYAFFDGLGRKIQTRVETEDQSKQIVTDNVLFNSRGEVEKQFVPYFENKATEYNEADTNKDAAVFTYDPVGRKIRSTMPDNSYTRAEYSLWQVDAYSYNSEGGNEQHKTTIMDAYGRVVEVKEYNGVDIYSTTYYYDARDNLVNLLDEGGNQTVIEYDSLGRKWKLEDPDTGITKYTYDANGNLKTQVDANGNTITFTYDDLNRVTLKDYSDDTPDVTYTYDNETISNGIGRLYSVTNGAGGSTVVYDYDERGRVKSETATIDTVDYTYSYTYDTMGRKEAISYPDGQAVLYSYNAGGAIERVSLKNGSTTYDGYFVKDVDYNAAGQMTDVEYGNEVKTNYVYNEQTHRLEHLTSLDSNNEQIQNLAYGFDNNGNVKQITDTVNTNSQTYRYDDLNRLIEAEGSYGFNTYEYDALGNIVEKDGITYSYANGNDYGPHQLTGTSDGRTYDYDECGNMTWRGDDELIYDADNRLTQLTYEAEAEGISELYSLTSGWNGVSFNYLPVDKTVTNVLSELEFGVDYDQVSYYDTTEGAWKHFVNNAAFNDFTELDYGVAYEINALTDKAITVVGLLSGSQITYNFTAGDNFIGVTSEGSVSVTNYLDNANYEALEVFDEASQSWVNYSGANLDPKKAYNVKMALDEYGTQDFNLAQGWNAVNFDFLPEGDKSVEAVLSSLTFGVDYDQISYYDSGTSEWKHFVNNSEFNDFDVLSHGREYRVFVTNAGGVNFSVTGKREFGFVSHSFTVPATNSIHYTYGPDGERIKKVNASGTTRYIGSGYEIRPSGGATKSVFLGDFRIAEIRTDGDADGYVFFLHTDHLGSTNVVTNADGEAVQNYEYDPYGKTEVDEASESSIAAGGNGENMPHKFTGQEEDAEAKLYYYHARYYDPELGRFIQADS